MKRKFKYIKNFEKQFQVTFDEEKAVWRSRYTARAERWQVLVFERENDFLIAFRSKPLKKIDVDLMSKEKWRWFVKYVSDCCVKEAENDPQSFSYLQDATGMYK